jgi:hypothetical protein
VDAQATKTPWLRSHTLWFCLALYAMAIAWGIRAAYVQEGTATEFAYRLALIVCLCTSAIEDARRRGKPIPRSQYLWYILFPEILVPGYVIGSRGWRGAGWLALHIVALTGVIACAFLAALAV